MDFIIDLFVEWFAETLAGRMLVRFFLYLTNHIKSRWVRIMFMTVSIVISAAIAVAVAAGIVILIILLIVKLFNL
jgi:hypothetical protein